MDLKRLLVPQPDRKAIPYIPSLAVQSDPIIQAGAHKSRLTQREAPRHLEAYGGRSDAIDWVMDCIRLIGDTAANASYHFEKDTDDPDILDRTIQPEASLRNLFKKPNPYMLYGELLHLLATDLLLVGNHYWYLYGGGDKPAALYRLAPPYVTIVTGSGGNMIDHYEYKLPGQKDPLRIKPEDLVHFKLPNPHNPYYGLGVIQGGGRPLDAELAIQDTQASYYERGALPSGVVQSERRVADSVFAKLKKQLRALYSGPKNAGQLMVLEAGLKYTAISPNALDAAFDTVTRQSRDRIFAMFRVPPPLVGITENANYKMSESQRIFDSKTMRPILNLIQNAVTEGVASRWGVRFVIDYEYTMPDEDRIQLAGEVAKLPGIRVREVREQAGFDPIGDERDDIVLNLPGINGTEGDERPGPADRNLPGEPGRPPSPERTAAFPEPGEPLPKGAAARKGIQDVLRDLKALESRPPDAAARAREAAVDAATEGLTSDILEAIHYLERDLLDRAEGKAVSTLIARMRKTAAWKSFDKALTDAAERRATELIQDAISHQAGLGHVIDPEDVDAEAAARSVLHRPSGLPSIVKNLRDSLITRVTRASKERPDERPANVLRDAVVEELQKWRDGHAETVALTELTEAYNEGTLIVGEQTGATQVTVYDGDEHDEPCAEANGSIWDIDYARDHRKEHPRCRRAFGLMPAPTPAEGGAV